MYTPTAEALQQRDQTDRTSCESWETTYSASDIAHMDFVSTKPGAPQSPLSHCSTFTRSQSEPVTSFLPQYAHIDAGTLQSMASLTLETSQFAMSVRIELEIECVQCSGTAFKILDQRVQFDRVPFFAA
jgi:hypothetical protein